MGSHALLGFTGRKGIYRIHCTANLKRAYFLLVLTLEEQLAVADLVQQCTGCNGSLVYMGGDTLLRRPDGSNTDLSHDKSEPLVEMTFR